jgi:hypothetical protein
VKIKQDIKNQEEKEIRYYEKLYFKWISYKYSNQDG